MRRLGIAIILVWLGLSQAPAAANQDAPAALSERRVALVIGNNNYQYAGGLRNAVADAQAFKRELEGRGFSVVYRENGTRRAMNDAIEEFIGKLSSDAIGVVFYSGHGIQINNDNFMLPVDLQATKEADIVNDGIDQGRLLDRISQAQPKFTLVVIDACRDNPFHAAGRSFGGTRGLAPPAGNASGIMVVYSAGANQQALDRLSDTDNDPNGLFTREFLKAVRQPGVTVQDAIYQVKLAVIGKAKSVGHVQTPAIYDQSVGTFYFAGPANDTPAPPQAGGATDREAVFWESVKDSQKAADFDAYLTKYPNGDFAPLARSRLESLKGSWFAPLISAFTPKPVRPPSPSPVQTPAVVPAPPPPPALQPGPPSRVYRDCPDCPEMVVIPGGGFIMGASPAEKGNDDARPQHQVTLRPFAIGKFDVTFAEWDACVADGGCDGYRPDDQGWGRGNRPVIMVNWQDARAYVAWLNGKLRQKGDGSADRPYRLPSEAEWEYAAKAGTTTKYWWGDELGVGNANCEYCGGVWGGLPGPSCGRADYMSCGGQSRTSPVDAFRPNPFGLYDMAGNVYQLLADCYHDSYAYAPTDGSAATGLNGCIRVRRGGNWDDSIAWLGSSTRQGIDSADARRGDAGFRVARSEEPPVPPHKPVAPPTAPGSVFRDCPDCPEMVVIADGGFLMGSPTSDKQADRYERPRHKVTIHSFALGKYDVTRGEFAVFVKETGYSSKAECQFLTNAGQQVKGSWQNPGFEQTDRDPVVCVSYQDAVAYLSWLGRKFSPADNDNPYRMPSESEWEYAARAGTTTRYWWGDNIGSGHANCIGCGQGESAQTSPVGRFPPNPFGLYDMGGNVQQLTQDGMDSALGYNRDGLPTDGSPAGGFVGDDYYGRVVRGGSWTDKPKDLRSAARDKVSETDALPYVGFRAARMLP